MTSTDARLGSPIGDRHDPTGDAEDQHPGDRQLVDAHPPAADNDNERGQRKSLFDGLIDLIVANAITAAVVLMLFKPWSRPFRIPYAYAGDGLFYAAEAKIIAETGWMQETGRLGAPFRYELYDFPVAGDAGNYLLIRFLALFTDDWAVLFNGFYLLTFLLTTTVALVCLRALGVTRLIAVVFAVLYSFAPYHFLRVGHLPLSNYAMLPIAVVLAVRAASGLPVISARRERLGSTVAALTGCVLLATFGAYYAIFALLLLAIAGAFAGVLQRSIRATLPAIMAGAVVAGLTIAVHAPSLLYWARNGTNPAVGDRLPIEIDVYGLRLIQMITPPPGSRIPLLDELTRVWTQGYTSEATMYFGIVGAAALIAMLAWSLIRVAGGASVERDSTRGVLATMSLVVIFVASTGGLNWIQLTIGFDRIRSWNRMSVIVLFMSLAFAGVSMSRIRARQIATRGRTAAVAWGVGVVAVLGVGLLDQANPTLAPDAEPFVAAFNSDRAFFREVEAVLEPGAAVFVMPIRPFPESNPTVNSADYDLLRPYLHTGTLRWSYGGMKGREADWQNELATYGTQQFVDAAIATGFSGVVIDTFGYEDRGAAVRESFSDYLDREPLVSPDGRWLFYTLDRDDSELDDSDLNELRDRLLAPFEEE